MRSIIIPLLVLLFSMRGAQTQNTQTEVQTESTGADVIQVDVYAELRELRDMVVEQRALLSVTQNEVETLRTKNSVQETELAVLKTRLAASETEVVKLFKANEAQGTEIMVLKMENAAQETRLSATETEVENLKMETAAQETELTAVKTRLAAIETDVVNLEKVITEQPKVAFSAALTNTGYLESGNTELNLVFTKIITNVGQAYSSTTGFFTAPVRGVYYFRFTVVDNLSNHRMFIRLLKNGVQVTQLTEYDTDGQAAYLSSGVTLQLEVGDEVNMRLPAGHRLFDDIHNHSTFSGFLLFPL